MMQRVSYKVLVEELFGKCHRQVVEDPVLLVVRHREPTVYPAQCERQSTADASRKQRANF